MNNVINLIYIGEEFYSQSSSRMSCLYVENSWERFDWRFVSRELRVGNVVNIRPANLTELDKARSMLAALPNKS